MSGVFDRHDDPKFFRDLLRLFRAARTLSRAMKSLTERQRAQVYALGIGPALSAIQAAVSMLSSYKRPQARGEGHE